jgi:dTDP-4-amino-4,6-dideoxygalactose transaminase
MDLSGIWDLLFMPHCHTIAATLDQITVFGNLNRITIMNIPLVNLHRQYLMYKNDYEKIISENLASCDYILGKSLIKFEENFAAYLGVKHVVGVGSGTDALTLLLKAIGCGQNTVVLTQDNTFIATTLAITNNRGQIALSDIDEHTYAIDIHSYEGERPHIILPVHLYGFPYEVDKISEKFGPNAIIIEDACQAHGSHINGKKCGSMGLASAFSFYPGKNLGAFGDGGAVATNDDNLAEEIRSLRNWGSKVKYIHDREGGNSRLDTLQAAILDFKLKHMDEWNEKRNIRAGQYRKNLSDMKNILLPPEAPENGFQNYHLFVIRLLTTERDETLKQLKEKGILAGIHYPVPIHDQKVYASFNFAKKTFPVTSKISRQILSLPLFPEITEEEVDIICDAVRTIIMENRK